MRPRDRGLPWDAERVGMAALVAVALVFGVHSAIDWTWFVPANALLRPARGRLGRRAAAAAHAAWRPRRWPRVPPLRARRETAPAVGAAATEPSAVADVAGPARCRSPTRTGAAARRSRGPRCARR